MSRMKRAAKNTSILMGMELGTRLMDGLVAILVARHLSPEGFGLLAFAVSFSWLFGIVPGFGMGSLSIRDVSREPDQQSRYLINGLVAKLFLAAAALALMGGIGWLSRFPSERMWAVGLAGLLMITETNLQYTLGFFQAAQRMSPVAGVSLLVRAGWVVGSLAVMGLGGGVAELLAVRVGVTAAGFAGALVLVHFRLGRIRWSVEPRFIWRMLKSSVPFALFRLKGKANMDIDTVMLSAMLGDLVTGWYAAAQRFIKLLAFVPASVYGAMVPMLSRAFREDSKGFARMLRGTCEALLLVGFPIAVAGFFLAEPLILTLFGPEYRQAAGVLRILIWMVPLAFLNSGLLAALSAADKEWKGSFVQLGWAGLSGLSNLVVIPLWGVVGAASTTLAAEAVVCLLQMRILRRVLRAAAPRAAQVPSVAGAPGLWAQPHAALEPGITVHFLVRNEERFIRAAVEAVLPLAGKVLIYDTGSTDRTPEILAAMRDEKMEWSRVEGSSREDLTRHRNGMIARTQTEWFMVVDGDEVYPSSAVEWIRQEIARVPAGVDRILVRRLHFIESPNFISRSSYIGRIFRTSRVQFFLKDGWFQTPYLVDSPSVWWKWIPSVAMPVAAYFFHFHYCQRSSRDAELGNLRRWRRPPFPVLPYLGPWPAGMDLNGASRRLTWGMVGRCLALNAVIFRRAVQQLATRTYHRLTLGEPSPGLVQ